MTHPLMKMRPFVVEELVWETHNCFTLRLKPEDPADMIEFVAGQWIYLHLLNEDGSSWGRAAFSIASAPESSKGRLELGIKVYGDFTKRASNLMPGDKVEIQGPFGRFILPEDKKNLVMFGAGIGIVPLLCMIRSLAARKEDVNVTLFYSNKTIEDITYREELDRIAKDWPHLKVVHFLSQEKSVPEGFEAELGRMSGEDIDKHVPGISTAHFFMCGPRGYMDMIRTALADRGVDLKTCLHEELFG